MDRALNPENKVEESWPRPARSFSDEAIRVELENILGSRTFRAAQSQKKFLAFAVDQVLAGRAHLLKEYVIATEALGRTASFDPRLDPIVRTEARKLRARLDKYYATEGSGDPLRVEFPKGTYVPSFHHAHRPDTEPPGEAQEVHTPPVPGALEAPLLPDVPANRVPSRRSGLLVLLAVLVLAVAGAIVFHLSPASFSNTTLAANDASIAVLPLVNLGDNNQEFLSDGLTDELIDALRQVPGLQVVARTSAFRFKAKTFDFREIDQKLHVRAVLVGSVRNSENRLTVAVQLNNAENGYHLWSGSYERNSANIGTIPPEIATAVTNVLGVGQVRAGAQSLSQATASPNSGAHEDYLRGLYFRNRYNADSLNKAIEYFKQAIAEDPSFAQAYAGLADCYAMARPVFATPPLEVVPKIKAAASKALELDAKLGDPHIDLAVSAEYEFDWAAAEREFKKGLALSPGNVEGTFGTPGIWRWQAARMKCSPSE